MKRALFVLLALFSSCHHDTRPGAPAVRYLALGDSFTAGTGSPAGAAFPTRLAALLTADGREVELENAAVSGYTSADVVQRELRAVARFSPTYVTLAVGANDIVRGTSPEVFATNVRAIVSAVIASGIDPANLVGLPQPEWPRSPTGSRFEADVALVRRYDAICAKRSSRSAGAGPRSRRSSARRPMRTPGRTTGFTPMRAVTTRGRGPWPIRGRRGDPRTRSRSADGIESQ